MNKNNKNTKNNSNNKNSNTKNINSKTKTKNFNDIDNNIKNSKSTSTISSNTVNHKSSTSKRIDNDMRRKPNITVTDTIEANAQKDRNKTYIVLVWQSRTAGIIRRIMEVPGTKLNKTLDTIRMQRKAFSFYEKR